MKVWGLVLRLLRKRVDCDVLLCEGSCGLLGLTGVSLRGRMHQSNLLGDEIEIPDLPVCSLQWHIVPEPWPL